ncbi:GAF and ANTAR domain-containing protein [Streptomyces sp. H27-C3]|uniref:GAF and ANTAR domain-containing protein n=1 Tax=Streptomyces sp. H27-C3 TaxID=3046305 RepID=UPI0024BABC6C|nr:GAF and ANTAR domain-containing protein [Streptomyces sp. H27-C3]MDJ0463464.1 GAF and ANTAR domain-containing protein [Streptomyces sp. H27-C3]
MTDTADATDVTGAAGATGRSGGFDLASLHRALSDWRGLDPFLQELTERAVHVIGGTDSCSITMRRHDRLVTAASSDGLALALDGLQYDVEAGPCVCSLDSSEEEYVPDMLEERRWGPYPRLASAHGIRSVLATPLVANSSTLGALNLYSRTPRAYEGHKEAARRLSAQAAGAVAVADRMERETGTGRDLRAAMLSRSVIDQAIGIVMARQRCPADVAMAVLRRTSQGRNIKLRDLCAELVAHTGGTPPGPGTFARRL